MFRILAINPGSSSTKVAVYDDELPIFSVNLVHSKEDLALFKKTEEQFEFRKNAILKILAEHNIGICSVCAVVGRGGILNPVESGAYRINDKMLKTLYECPKENASRLGAFLAAEIAKTACVPAYIFDSVAVDEMWDLTRLTGLPGVERSSIGHALNMKAVARNWAKINGKSFEQLTLIVAHLGGGITLSLHHHGRMVDMISDDEGPFGPERSGMIPARKLIDLIFSKSMTRQEAFDCLQGTGTGLHGMLGTADTIEVESRIAAGDRQARLCYESMAFNVAKHIGLLATEVSGQVDQIILTGGTAYSPQFTKWITDRVSFIAPVDIQPGDRELEAMALGILKVLRGEEQPKTYTHAERPPLLQAKR